MIFIKLYFDYLIIIEYSPKDIYMNEQMLWFITLYSWYHNITML